MNLSSFRGNYRYKSIYISRVLFLSFILLFLWNTFHFYQLTFPLSNRENLRPRRPVELARASGTRELWIVSACTSNHYEIFSSLLLPSLHRHLDPLATKILFYDLGLTDPQRQELQRYFPDVICRKFPFHKYPDHLNVQQDVGYWAWKPVIITVLAQECKTCLLLWLDGGNRLTGDLQVIRSKIQDRGVWSQMTSKRIKHFTHPLMFQALQIDPSPLLNLPNCDGAMVGIDCRNTKTMTLIVKAWMECALKKACIAPEGSSRRNHRQDQAALTVLMKFNHLPCLRDDGKKHHIHKHMDNKPLGQQAIAQKQQKLHLSRILIILRLTTLEETLSTVISLRRFMDPYQMQLRLYHRLHDPHIHTLQAHFPEIHAKSCAKCNRLTILQDAGKENGFLLYLHPGHTFTRALETLNINEIETMRGNWDEYVGISGDWMKKLTADEVERHFSRDKDASGY